MKKGKQPLPRMLVSACFCGVSCRYDGGASSIPKFLRLAEEGLALPVCPEIAGGLFVPRTPCEILEGRVISRAGKDFTEAYARGAASVLEEALRYGIDVAILKEKSPSCGSAFVYDGSFTGKLVPGEGITAALLRRNGIAVWSEATVPPDFFW